MQRYGMTIPFGLPLAEQEDLIKEMVDLGYTDFWSSESNGADGFHAARSGGDHGRPRQGSASRSYPRTRGARR